MEIVSKFARPLLAQLFLERAQQKEKNTEKNREATAKHGDVGNGVRTERWFSASTGHLQNGVNFSSPSTPVRKVGLRLPEGSATLAHCPHVQRTDILILSSSTEIVSKLCKKINIACDGKMFK